MERDGISEVISVSFSDVFLMKISSVYQVLSDISKSQIFTYMRRCRAVTLCGFSEFKQHCKTERIVFQVDALATAVIKSKLMCMWICP